MQYDPLTDGWGATTDGRHLIVSDGSSNISWLDPNTLQKLKSVAVNDNGKLVPMLNEVCRRSCHAQPVLYHHTYDNCHCSNEGFLLC